ncbi:hypothetical protein Hjap01_03701 [Haloarcula japonica]
MDYLENVTVDELEEILAEVDEKKPVQRVPAGIAYKDVSSSRKLRSDMMSIQTRFATG